jgi:hypothetical protein
MSKNITNKVEANLPTIQEPRICLIDFSEKDVSEIQKSGYNVYNGSLGTQIIMPKKEKYNASSCLLNYDLPGNIHEYDIIVINMDSNKSKPYNLSENSREVVKGSTTHYFLSSYPETVFDPRPYVLNLLSDKLEKIKNKETVVILFSSSKYSIDYNLAKIGSKGIVDQNKLVMDNQLKIDIPINSDNKFGKKIKFPIDEFNIHDILRKYQTNFNYDIIFYHPSDYKKSGNVKLDRFFPLIYNSNDEIISYMLFYEKIIDIVLPQLDNKYKIILDLLNDYLPGLIPSLFPHSTKNLWLMSEVYSLPNHKNLIELQNQIKMEFEANIKQSQKEIDDNNKKWKFLHDMLIESGDELVKAVEKFLNWLGFDKIIDMDRKQIEKSKIKEEDLQILIDQGLLIIEVKGIGGTSKDSECSQISKVKHRRCKERNKFDVFALYIVNHQRYLPPNNRLNPPFTHDQIKDAINDERGLLTTWQLFKLYHAIERCSITKEEARNQLLNYGLIEFVPSNLISISEPIQILKDNTVIIVKLDNLKIVVNDILYIEDSDHEFYIVRILEIQLNGIKVDECDSGEVGILLSDKIPSKSSIWKKA